MAKKTVQELREKAKMLLQQAEEIEKQRAIKIGKLVIAYEAVGFDGFNLDTFKEQIAKM